MIDLPKNREAENLTDLLLDNATRFQKFLKAVVNPASIVECVKALGVVSVDSLKRQPAPPLPESPKVEEAVGTRYELLEPPVDEQSTRQGPIKINQSKQKFTPAGDEGSAEKAQNEPVVEGAESVTVRKPEPGISM